MALANSGGPLIAFEIHASAPRPGICATLAAQPAILHTETPASNGSIWLGRLKAGQNLPDGPTSAAAVWCSGLLLKKRHRGGAAKAALASRASKCDSLENMQVQCPGPADQWASQRSGPRPVVLEDEANNWDWLGRLNAGHNPPDGPTSSSISACASTAPVRTRSAAVSSKGGHPRALTRSSTTLTATAPQARYSHEPEAGPPRLRLRM